MCAEKPPWKRDGLKNNVVNPQNAYLWSSAAEVCKNVTCFIHHVLDASDSGVMSLFSLFGLMMTLFHTENVRYLLIQALTACNT